MDARPPGRHCESCGNWIVESETSVVTIQWTTSADTGGRGRQISRFLCRPCAEDAYTAAKICVCERKELPVV